MQNKFKDFNEKRLLLFRELVKRYWNGELHDSSDLDKLTQDLIHQFGFGSEDVPFIKDHIRIAMGQEPNNLSDFTSELDVVAGGIVNKPVVSKINGYCQDCDSKACGCVHAQIYKYEVARYNRSMDSKSGEEDCIDCGLCVEKCDYGMLADKMEFIPMVNLLKDEKARVFAVVAPAIAGQLGEQVTMGKLRTALKQLGFEDMIEVALFADILTIKEAFEFSHLVLKENDFFLTSCCCPIWFNTIKHNYPEIYDHLSPSVSPMIAAGRILKKLYGDARIVFIAPCIAKKSEAKDKELVGAIDYVLDFRELKEVFQAVGIDLAVLAEDDKDQASFGGRAYARTGGVSFAVKSVVNRIDAERVIRLKSKKSDGVKACRIVLDALRNGTVIDANFIEGMGCIGGCVGGPKTIVDAATGTRLVNEYAEDSFILTPLDNLNVIRILEQFGIPSIEHMLKDDDFLRLLSR